MTEHFRIQVCFPGVAPYWVDVICAHGEEYRLTFPGERWRNLEFRGGWNKDERLELWAPDGSHFIVRGDWFWLDYTDAYAKATYPVPVLMVEEPDVDPELDDGFHRAMQSD